MRRNMVLFDPAELAIVKGIAGSISFSASVLFADETSVAFSLSVAMFCLGFISDYIEVAVYRKLEKHKVAQRFAWVIIILTGVFLCIAIGMAVNPDSATTKLVVEHAFILRLFLAIYWVIPFYCAFQLRPRKKKQAPPKFNGTNGSNVYPKYYTPGNIARLDA